MVIEPPKLLIEEDNTPLFVTLPPIVPFNVVVPVVVTSKSLPVIAPFNSTLFKVIVADVFVTFAIVVVAAVFVLSPIVILFNTKSVSFDSTNPL